ncbi:MAG TPA: CHAD domain-containing protein [Stellaceae bacterium]|nr:CHAD domain-containing protein [Stellaceae bacterium]
MTEALRRGPATASVLEIGSSTSPTISPDTTVGAGLQALLGASLRGLRHPNHRGETERPESVHRFRVGLRRLRSLISAFRSVLPEAERKALGARLSALGKRYSRVREWDVFLAGTLRPMAAALEDEPALLELEACAREARRRALPGPVNFQAEGNEVASAIAAANWLHHAAPEFAAEWRGNLKDFATTLLAKNHRRLRKRLKVVDLARQESFHELRIQAKKMRYPVEMFEDMFDKNAIDEYLERLIAVQDSLGHLNDALVARSLINELPLSSRPQGLANGWLAHEVEFCRERFPSAAKKLRKAKPFWNEV